MLRAIAPQGSFLWRLFRPQTNLSLETTSPSFLWAKAPGIGVRRWSSRPAPGEPAHAVQRGSLHRHGLIKRPCRVTYLQHANERCESSAALPHSRSC